MVVLFLHWPKTKKGIHMYPSTFFPFTGKQKQVHLAVHASAGEAELVQATIPGKDLILPP